MSHSFLVFDFGTDEDAAQKARHRIDGWRQAFRLDKKLQVKFERQEAEPKSADAPAAPAKAAKPAVKGKSKAGGKSKSAPEPEAEAKPSAVPPAKIRLIVRLDFSDHEKLSRQRWIERIPADELFKGAHPQIVVQGEGQFAATSDLFDELD